MSLKLGTNDISKAYIGSTEVSKAYLGSTLVYSSTPPNGLLNNLNAYYKADTNGSFPSEINSPTNDLIIQGATFTTDGYSFDGNNDYIERNINLSVDSFPFSFSLWLYSGANSGFRTPIQIQNRNVDNNYARLLFTNRQPQINLRGTSTLQSQLGSTLSQNTWYHFVGIWKSNTDIKIYQDTVDITGTLSGSSGDITSDYNRFSLGRAGDSSPGNYWQGKIKDIAIYKKDLTETDRNNLYNNGTPLPFEDFTN